MPKYNAANRTTATRSELEELVGAKARLPLTGRFVRVSETDAGAFMIFQVDERWGFPPKTNLGVDIEAFDKIKLPS